MNPPPKRAVLFDPAATCRGDFAHPLFHDWTIDTVRTPAAAREHFSRHGPAIGLVVFDDPSPLEAEAFETQLWQDHIEWLALISPTALSLPAMRELLCRAFFDHHTLPIDAPRLAFAMGHAWGRMVLAASPTSRLPDCGLIGQSPSMQALRQKIERVARADANVLITGETGSGKERVARAIAARSPRAGQAFVAVNCASFSPHLIQSALFGHERGAFTGATSRHIGHIEAAHRGTLLLDEIGDLPLPHQAHLLRVLEERTVTRLGAQAPMPVDVRVLAASHVDLSKAVRRGEFREDLYHRLNVLTLEVPPLRSRGEDVLLLAESLLAAYRHSHPTPARGFSARARQALLSHDWPGNVRELSNRIHRAVVMGDSRLISDTALGLAHAPPTPADASLKQTRDTLTREAIEATLRAHPHNMTRAAQRMGISRATLYRLMQRLGIGARQGG